MDPIDELVEKMKAVNKTRCLLCKGSGFVTAKLAPSGWETYPCPVCKRDPDSSRWNDSEKKT